MYRRAMIGLISVLSCCALACVGFSAWSITTDDMFTASSSGTLTSEDVILSDEYVWVDMDSIETLNATSFLVSPYGFVHKEGEGTTIDTIGELLIPLKIDKEKCGDFTSNKVAVNVSISFKQSGNYNLWRGSYLSPSCENEKVTVNGGISSNDQNYTMALSFNLSDVGDSFTLKLTFNFARSTQNYQNLLYNMLLPENEKITNPFVFVVMVSDGSKA